MKEGTEYKKFLKELKGLAEIYDKKLTRVVIDIYWRTLKNLSIEDFERNLANVLKFRKYPTFPLPAELNNENVEQENMPCWNKIK